VRRALPLFLLGLWLLAWGDVSVANVVTGVALVVVLFLVFPVKRHGPRVRVHPLGLARLLGYVVVQLVVSNVLVAREIVSHRSRVRTGVIRYEVEHPSDLTVTLMSNILALSPGTMPVDVIRQPTTILVHFLLLSDVDAARRAIGRLETLVVGAVEPEVDVDATQPASGGEPG
jgi:multicomponent Na+:H+ antiporter subunit E